MEAADGELDDRNQRDPGSGARELVDEKGRLLAEFGAELDRVRRAWDTGLRETIGRLDQLVAQVDEAVRLTRVLVAGWHWPAS